MRLPARTAGHARAAVAIAGTLALLTPSSLLAYSRPVPTAVESASAQHHHTSLPDNFDIRNEIAASRTRRVGATARRQAAEARLESRSPGVRVDLDEASGLPKMVTTGRPGERLSAAAPGSAVDAARAFLDQNRDLYGLNPSDLATASVLYTSEPRQGEHGATIVRFKQTIGDVPVFGAELAVVMGRDRAVVGTSGTLYPAAAPAAGRVASRSMADGVALAAADLTGNAFVASEFAPEGLDSAGYTLLSYAADRGAGLPFFSVQPRARQVIFPVGAGETIPAYYVELMVSGEPSGSGPAFSYVVSAEDGRVLFRNNLVCDQQAYQYRVYANPTGDFQPYASPQGSNGTPHPVGVPDHFQAPYVAAQDITIVSLLGPTDPWLPDDATSPTGNNVQAYLDPTSPDGLGPNDIAGSVTGPNQFLWDFNPDLSTTDATVRQAKITHMFFFNNWLHDIWYPLGFDEASRNAQGSNYGRGGAENDSIKAEGEDRGTNNANMSTPADGGRPRMQMFRFTLSNVPGFQQRDSSSDFGIVAHEWMHYMSNRLVNNASGLVNNQGRSMGEGWADWNALINIIEPDDDFDGAFTTGAWATLYLFSSSYDDNYYFGIRRYPYSTRFDRFPLTFKNIGAPAVFPDTAPRNTQVGGSMSEVHNSGEVWCNMLWEMSASLIRAHGFEDGRTRAMRYVVDGMKNTPSSPTFGQARDGIIAAINASDPADVPLAWQAFARRGIGEGAVSPAPNSGTHAGVVESFVAPAALTDDTIGFALGNTLFERNLLLAGPADSVLAFGAGLPTQIPLVGNWDGGTAVGADSADTPGVYDTASGFYFLKLTNTPGDADLVFGFGTGGTNLPIKGDWNGDGVDTIGIYDPASGLFFLKDTNAPGNADYGFQFGPAAAGFIPVAGDWDGDGDDTVGLYDPASGNFFLTITNGPGVAAFAFQFGVGGGVYQPIAGDWNSDGTDTVGLYDTAGGQYLLRNLNQPGSADVVVSFGPSGAFRPVAGNFDGQ